MNDKELADKIVALGVGAYDALNNELMWPPGASQVVPGVSAFVRDWRVAGAMMEKCGDLHIWKLLYGNEDLEGGELVIMQTGHEWVVEPPLTKDARQDESLPRAINEACVEALS